jgi:hypothetical protein
MVWRWADILLGGCRSVTGSGIDLDVVTEVNLRCRNMPALLTGVVLERYDMVIFSVGSQDALDFVSPDKWSKEAERILDLLTLTRERTLPVCVIAVPRVSNVVQLDPWLARRADRRAAHLNARLFELCQSRSGVTFVPFQLGDVTETCRCRTSDTYGRWADVIMAGITPTLGVLRREGRPGNREQDRQGTADWLNTLENIPDEAFDSVTASAQSMFRTVGAGIVIIDDDREWFASTSGLPIPEIPYGDPICNHIIHTNHGVAIEDVTLDPRFAGSCFAVTLKLHSYAGIPIRNPHGHMIGALCVYDDKPRLFGPTDMVQLRDLAHLIENRLGSAK